MIDPVHITPKPTNMKKARHIDEPSFPFPLKRSVAHATGGSQCRHESGKSGYYHLHHYLNQSILLHNSQFSTLRSALPLGSPRILN